MVSTGGGAPSLGGGIEGAIVGVIVMVVIGYLIWKMMS